MGIVTAAVSVWLVVAAASYLSSCRRMKAAGAWTGHDARQAALWSVAWPLIAVGLVAVMAFVSLQRGR